MQATITQNGKTEQLTGTGYHDHNWGNAPMMILMHHWYWGRAKIGDYQVISSYIYGAKKYGYAEFPIFMLAKDGAVLADDPEKYLKYSEQDAYIDEKTGKTTHKALVYDYDDGKQHYRVTFLSVRSIRFPITGSSYQIHHSTIFHSIFFVPSTIDSHIQILPFV